MSDMIERVAQAMFKADCAVPNNLSTEEMYRNCARAAVREMLKPTEAMVLSAGEVLLDACSSEKGNLHPWKPFDVAQVALKAYGVMITAALSDTSQLQGGKNG